MQKSVFESGRGVLRLDWYYVSDDPEYDQTGVSVWYHIPYVNQQSWAIVLTRLFPDTYSDNNRLAKAAGHTALRAAPNGCQLSEDVFEPDRPFHAWGIDNCPRAFAFFNFERMCTCSTYQVVEGGSFGATVCPSRSRGCWHQPQSPIVASCCCRVTANG